jgi:hypothetical protein
VSRRVDLNSKELCPPTPAHATNRCVKKRPQPRRRTIERQRNARSGHSSLRNDWEKTYQQASNRAREQFNIAVFRSITIQEKHVFDYELAQPFRSLLGNRF